MEFGIAIIAFIILESIACIFSVVGNVIVIYAMTREKKLERKSNIYVLSVAFADLLVALVVIPLTVYNVRIGSPSCAIFKDYL